MTIVDRNPAIPLIAAHPAYQYLAKSHSLNLKSVLWEREDPSYSD